MLVEYSYVPARIEILNRPLKGKVSRIGNTFFMYDPEFGFTTGKDNFTLGVLSASGLVLGTLDLVIEMVASLDALPCSLMAVGDTFRSNPTQKTSFSLLGNDKICDFRREEFKWSIVVPPVHGHAMASGDSVEFTPDPGYQGADRLIYQLQSIADPSIHSLGYSGFLISTCDLDVSKIQLDITDENVPCFNEMGFCLSAWSNFLSCFREMGAEVSLGIYKSASYGLVTISDQEVFYKPLLMTLTEVRNDSFSIHIRYKFADEYEFSHEAMMGVFINRTPSKDNCLWSQQEILLDLTDDELDPMTSPSFDSDCPVAGYWIPYLGGTGCQDANYGFGFGGFRQSRHSGSFCWDFSSIVYIQDIGVPQLNDTLWIEMTAEPMAIRWTQRHVVKR